MPAGWVAGMIPTDPLASQGPFHRVAAALTARLLAGFPANRFQHELLPAPLSDKTLPDLSSAKQPLVGLAFLGLKSKANVGRVHDGAQRWAVYLLTQNPKARPRLLGDSIGPGLAQMIHCAILGLHGWTIGGAGRDGAGTIMLTDIETLDGASWGREHSALAAVTLEVQGMTVAPNEQDFLKLGVEWAFGATPPGATAATDILEPRSPE